MIRRLYVDNYRCLVNFELELGPLQLLMGPNGGGKSTVFDVLRLLRSILDGMPIAQLLPSSTLTRWQKVPTQRIELAAQVEGMELTYVLEVEHDADRRRARISRESLKHSDTLLFDFEMGEVRLFWDDGSAGPQYTSDWSRSALALVASKPENRLLTSFRDLIRSVLIVSPLPPLMSELAEEDEETPGDRAERVVGWYHRVSQDQGVAIRVSDALKEIVAGFSHFRFDPMGEGWRLSLVTEAGTTFRWSELSDGERMLCALYMLVSVPERHRVLCVDEPANYVALPEISPWLDRVTDLCSDGNLQAVIISHHPVWLERKAGKCGFWLDRAPTGPTRVQRIKPDDEGPLSFPVLVERGWFGVG